MTPIIYENLMRKAFSCEKNKAIGADAEIYESLEYFTRQLSNHNSVDTFQERMDDYKHAVTMVAGHVRRAITFSHAMIQHQVNEEQKDRLHVMQRTLIREGFYDKEELDRIIVEASELFEEFELLSQI